MPVNGLKKADSARCTLLGSEMKGIFSGFGNPSTKYVQEGLLKLPGIQGMIDVY
jgi:hypothetical protein